MILSDNLIACSFTFVVSHIEAAADALAGGGDAGRAADAVRGEAGRRDDGPVQVGGVVARIAAVPRQTLVNTAVAGVLPL